MEKILVDGCNYYVDTVCDTCDGSVHVEVTDDYHDKVGGAVVDHNSESVNVYYAEADEHTSYNYFELVEGREGLLQLAEWIVATDPINC